MSLSILKWICPPPETFEEPSQEDGKVEWFRCLPYVLIHLACLSAFFFPVTLPCILIALISYGVRMFAITAFYHRYFAHRSFKTSRLGEFLGAALAFSSGQPGPQWWGAPHQASSAFRYGKSVHSRTPKVSFGVILFGS